MKKPSMTLRCAHLLMLPALLLAACSGAPLPTPVRLSDPARAMGTVTVQVDGAVMQKKAAYRLQGKSFQDHQIAYLRLRALGADMSPVEQIIPWAPPLGPISLSLQVPQGANRVFILSGLNFAKQPVISFKGMASVTTGANTVMIHAGTTPAADALERVVVYAPSVAPSVSLSALQGLIDGAAEYDPLSRSYGHELGKLDTEAIASAIVASAGVVPVATAAYRLSTADSLAVAAVDAFGNPIIGDVRYMLSDPTSAAVVSMSSAEVISPAARGRWTLTASHPKHGSTSVEVQLPYASGSLSVTLTPHASAVTSVGTQDILFTSQKQSGSGTDGNLTTGRFSASKGRGHYAAPLAAFGNEAYVAEGTRIRKVDLTTGDITTLAGSEASGTIDGTGTAARFSAIAGLACDSAGTYLYVTDEHRIRRIVRSSGQVTTYAGDLVSGNVDASAPLAVRFKYPKGLAMNGPTLYVADSDNGKIRRINTSLNEAATTLDMATLSPPKMPLALAANGTSLYIATKDNEIWQYPFGGTPVRLSGVGSSLPGHLDGPANTALFAWSSLDESQQGTTAANVSLALATDTLYVSDLYNQRVRRISGIGATPIVSSVLGDGIGDLLEGQDGRVLMPAGLAWAGSDLLVFDKGNARLRRLNLGTNVIQRVAGGGPAGFTPGLQAAASFLSLRSLAFDRSRRRAFAVEPLANRVVMLDLLTGEFQVVAGTGDRGDQDSVAGNPSVYPTFRLSASSRLAFDEDSNKLYLSERNGGIGWRIRQLNTSSLPAFVTTLASSGLESPDFALDDSANVIFTATATLDVSTTTSSLTSYTPDNLVLLGARVLGVTHDHLYAARGSGSGPGLTYDRIVRFSRTGTTGIASETLLVGAAGSPGRVDGASGTARVANPERLELDPAGHYLYLQEGNPGLRRINLVTGSVETVWSTSTNWVHGLGFDVDGTLLLNVNEERLTRLRF
ncbi:MAG: hypothetical protein VKP62_05985 [Candidatus Sericytochromatia bacterium]|nr:hypothetical protein [Candidatus Sericytochromatia bacterium]